MRLQNIDAVKATASVFGVYGGLLGVEHGYFETLQGNVVPGSLKILASTRELPFPFGHEPAMTVIPSFLVTGILAIAVGLTIVAWSAAFLQRSMALRFCVCSPSCFSSSAEDSALSRS